MKLVCLNVWGGQIYEPLMQFVREQAPTTDIFCFQEVFTSPKNDLDVSHGTRIHLLEEIAAALPDFDRVFHPIVENIDEEGPTDFETKIGQAEFVRKSIPIVSSGEVAVGYPDREIPAGGFTFDPRKFGYVRTEAAGKPLTVINVHGLTGTSDNKLDKPERLEQSRVIKEFALNEKNGVIICGDFNILPQAESIKTFDGPFVDLIKKYGITRTRSRLSVYYGTPGEFTYSDYAFVSPGINVTGFTVPMVEISDHLPLIVEFG